MPDFIVPKAPAGVVPAAPVAPMVQVGPEVCSNTLVQASVGAFEQKVEGVARPDQEELAEVLWAVLRVQGFRVAALAREEARQSAIGGGGVVSKEISAFIRGVKTYQEIRGTTMRGRMSVGSDEINSDDERGKLIRAFGQTG